MQTPRLTTVSISDSAPVLDQIAASLEQPQPNLAALPTLTNVALGDPYLAEQLVALHQLWELHPAPARTLLQRVRTRLGWWLLGGELRQLTHVNATVVRIIDSLIVQLDQDRAARRRLEEHIAYHQDDV